MYVLHSIIKMEGTADFSVLSQLLLCLGWNRPPVKYGQIAHERPLEGAAGELGAQGYGKSIV